MGTSAPEYAASRVPQPTRVARYSRRIRAGIERVWENVRDWEHLPWLHRTSFRSIALDETGDFGWRARIGLANGRVIGLELVIEGMRYVSRTVAGEGAGSEIWTRLAPVDAAHTDIELEFLVPGISADLAPKLGAAYVALYTRLWDEDEAMMQRREAQLARRSELGPLPADARPVDIGPAAEARARAPFAVDFAGRPFRVVRAGDALVAHATTCPHWLGPLEEAPEADGRLRCPWHGYRFDPASGRGCDLASRLRLPPAPRVVIGADGRARLEP
jgi:nitrite reductase/ring-hydroxylating ferredoxin subunit